MLQAVEDEMRRRRFGEVVRLEVESRMNQRLRERLVDSLQIDDEQVYEEDGLLGIDDLIDIADVPGFDELRYPPFSGVTQPRLQGEDGKEADVMAAMREGDVLVHHPYDSFSTSVESFVRQAVRDPDVLAIKQTVYRTSPDSTLVPFLIEASERGKQAVCMVELKARFDEYGQHPLGEEAGGGGRPRRLRHPGAQDALQVHPRRPPRGRPRAPLRPHRDRQLQPEDRAPVHRHRPVHRRPGHRRRRRRDVQLPDRLLAPAPLPQGARRAVQPPARGSSRRSTGRSRRTRPAVPPGSG